MNGDRMTDSCPHKLVVIGDSGVGKTSILASLDNRLTDDLRPTTTPEAYFFTVKTDSGSQVQLSVWDTAGQDRFESITSLYFRGAVGVIFVFELSSFETFKSLDRWYARVIETEIPKVVLLIGNKSDLPRDVPINTADQWARAHNGSYIETSVVSNDGLKFILPALANALSEEDSNKNEGVSLQSEKKKKKKKSMCSL